MCKVYWLSGSSFLRKQSLDQIKALFAINSDIIYAKGLTYAEFEEMVFHENCFSEKRLILVNDWPTSTSNRAWVVNNIKKLIDKIPDKCTIVFNDLEGEGSKSLISHIKKHGEVIEHDIIVEKDNARFWVTKYCDNLGITIDDDIAQLFVDINCYDPNAKGIGLDVMHIGIDKLIQYIGKRKSINKQDVIINAFPSNDFVVWSIFSVLDTKDIGKCTSALKTLVDESDNVFSGIIQFLNLVTWRYRLLVFLKEQLAQNKNRDDIIKEACSLYKISTEGSGMSMVTKADLDNEGKVKSSYTAWAVQKELNGYYGQNSTVDKYTRKELMRILHITYKCLSEARFRTSESSMYLLGDAVIAAICNVYDDKQIDDIIGNSIS